MAGAQSDLAAPAGAQKARSRTPLQRAGDAALYAALRGVWSAVAALPVGRACGFLEAVGSAFGRIDRRHRRVVEENLGVAFPQMDGVIRDSIVEAAFRNWGRIAAEAVHCDELIDVARRDPAWRAVAAAVAEALSAGRGLLLLTAHIGNFELLARIFGSVVGPVAVIHRTLGAPDVDDFLLRERSRCGVTTLGRGASVRDALRLLAAGGCVAVPLDQNQREGRGIFIDVLGEPACTSTMLARLSLAGGTPVLPVFATWSADGRTSPVVGERIDPPALASREGRDEAIRDLTVRYSAEIDRVVRRFPHQWNWAHRRWKTRPAPPVSAT